MGQFEWTMSPMGLLGCLARNQLHREILQLLFHRLRKTGLKVNLAKCEFGSTEVAYLGFRLTPNGILPGKDKLQAVAATPPPANVHQVRQFLGSCNIFRTHICNFSLLSGPLSKLTRKDCPWQEGQLPTEAFKAYKEL